MTNGTRTRDIQNHNLALYQLSYSHHALAASVEYLRLSGGASKLVGPALRRISAVSSPRPPAGSPSDRPPANIDRGLADSAEYAAFLAGFLTERRVARFDEVLAGRTRRLVLALEDIHDRHNASACLRTADAFGVQEVHAIEGRNPFDPHPEIALGSAQWLDLVRHAGPGGAARCVKQLRGRGYRILATSSGRDAVPIESLDMDVPTALVFGNERDGLSRAVFDLADEHVTVPMLGFTESLNISVAVAISLHHLAWRLRGSAAEWRLAEEDRRRLRGRWIRQSIGPQRLALLTERFLAERTG